MARSALLLTFAVNLFYFSLVVAIAVFGLHRVAMWALKEAITDWRRRISNLGRGLSILVVFTALALLTAETWETMRRISTEHYLLLVGVDPRPDRRLSPDHLPPPIPATVIAAVVFFVLSHVTVPSPVAANWSYGDRASPTEIGELTRLPFLQQPWPRVALLLTAFSILTLAVDILSDPEKRKLFFGNSDMAVRRRLAVRLAYCEVLAHRKLPEQRYRRPF